ncbi:NACHT, LRR and PYD domains-containing protein 1 homolog isoform X2 [Danio aesculapii]|uniref:NACHT, LRR and PYD domains-containing protein 1 homolog isoform X2 n=1 Tax=Danio aesculapii TaxID=1142201 RepID=UPI0024C0BC07|nr:NACHT, LRR and PYD domains-containing protein 1 homolog isoform X2 [Danio aesculapii]
MSLTTSFQTGLGTPIKLQSADDLSSILNPDWTERLTARGYRSDTLMKRDSSRTRYNLHGRRNQRLKTRRARDAAFKHLKTSKAEASAGGPSQASEASKTPKDSDEEFNWKSESSDSGSSSEDPSWMPGLSGFRRSSMGEDPRWMPELSGLRRSSMVLEYKESIKQKFKKSFLSSEQVSLAAVYTEPVITEETEQVSFQNISVEDLFKPIMHLHAFAYFPKTVVLQGSSGCGKSFISQKIMLDWISGKHYLQHFDVVFYLRCEELKCVSEEMTLIELLSLSSSLPSDQISEILLNLPCRVLIIIDGLDELTFVHSDFWIQSLSHKASPEVIVCSLLSEQFVSRSTLLITTSTEVPQGMFFMKSRRLSKIMGFSEKGVEEYFQRFFQDEELFRKAFRCVNANETLITACSIPVVCWILCTVLRERFSEGSDLTNSLETTTFIYVDFLSTLLEPHSQGLGRSVPTLLSSLGQLAEKGMLETHMLFEEKSVNEIISDPEKLFLRRRTVRQETMFSFMHRSFQEFFAALYFVLLNEKEPQRKVKELLHTVERGWALSCCSDLDSLMTDVEVRHSEFLQPVILFLCGLCRQDPIPSFFEKHNMAVSVNIEAQLKEWINKCSQRYQNKHLLFILHCLYELHQKSFSANVLEHLNLLDLSNTPLTNIDCRMLQFCLESGVKMRNLRLNVTSDNLKSLHSALYCDELWLKVDHITDDVGDLISAFGEGKIVKELIVQNQKGSKASHQKETKSFCQKILASVKDQEFTLSVSCSKTRPLSLISGLTLTCSCSEISTVNWRIFIQKLSETPSFYNEVSSMNEFLPLDALHYVTGLKTIHLQTERWTDRWIPKILSIIQAFSSLNELRINAAVSFIPFNITRSLRESLTTGWKLTVWRKSVLIERDRTCVTEEELKAIQTENTESKRAELSSGQTSSDDAEIFTPELIQEDDKYKDKGKNTYRFVCPRAGQFQCSLTSLVFVMEGKGELLYRIVSWDPRLLDGLGQMQPAGPLYDIDCSAGSVSQLCFPHSEIFSEGDNRDGLAVAHFTGGNMEIIQPIKVTETHVMIDIRDLSLFGLLWMKIFSRLIRGQVLLFLRTLPVEEEEKILYVHLLPENVPVPKVQQKHQNKKYIETTPECQLFTEREYSLRCQPKNGVVQPMSQIFKLNFGPNYHPTFEVFLDVHVKKVGLTILDKAEDGKEVWSRPQILLTAPSQGVEQNESDRMTPESEFVDALRDKLIQRVLSVMAIADSLKSKRMITDELYNEVYVADTTQKKMRCLFKALDSGRASVKAEFYRLLKKNDSDLVDELESEHSGSSRPQ